MSSSLVDSTPHLGGFCLKIRLRASPTGGLRQLLLVLDLSQQHLLFVQSHMNAGQNGVLVEVGVGNGGEQIQGDQVVDLAGDLFPSARSRVVTADSPLVT